LRKKQIEEVEIRKQKIKEEKERVDDIVEKLQNYIYPNNTQTDDGWLKLLDKIKKG